MQPESKDQVRGKKTRHNTCENLNTIIIRKLKTHNCLIPIQNILQETIKKENITFKTVQYYIMNTYCSLIRNPRLCKLW